MKTKQKQSVYQRMKKSEYLEGVKGRLANDVSIYFEAIQREALQGNHVGFFGAVRLVFPTIEAVAGTLYRGERKTQRLLEKLNIEYPELVWQGFRNALSHNDHLGAILYRGKRVSWATSASGTGHIFRSGVIHIDTKSLYDDLVAFIDLEISSAGNTSVYVEVGTKYRTKASKRQKIELENILL